MIKYVNPVEQKLWESNIDLKREKNELKILEKDASYFNDSNVISNLISSYEHLLIDRPASKNIIKVFDDRITYYNNLLESVRREIYGTKKWFHSIIGNNKYVKSLVLQEKKLSQIVSDLRKTNLEKKDFFRKNEEKILSISTSIENFIDFDISDKLNQIGIKKNTIKNFDVEIEILETLNKAIKIAINKEVQILEKVQEDIISVTIFDRDLSLTTNSYEKKIIHDKCESLFGNSSPRYMIKVLMKKEQSLLKTIKSIILKVEKQSLFHARKEQILNSCKTVILDGNNLCNISSKDKNSYIGLNALIPLVIFLERKYKVVIIFDRGILGKEKTSFLKLKKRFSENVEIYIEEEGLGADILLVTYSSDDEGCFIISNDQYKEYLDTEALINERKLHCNIFSDKIIIHYLDIKISY